MQRTTESTSSPARLARPAVFLLAALAISTFSGRTAHADPPPPNFDIPDVFCFRITDIERVPGDAEGDRFLFQFEALNWTNTEAFGVNLALNEGTSSGVVIAGADVDPDGRGGPVGGTDIGPGTFDSTAIHSGRGRGDIVDHTNDWAVGDSSSTAVTWDAVDEFGPVGTSIPFRNLLGSSDPESLIPGVGTDGLGDSAIDGGPDPYDPEDPNFGGPPDPDGSGNELDGFVLDIDGLGVGDTLSFNWFLLGFGGPEQPTSGSGSGIQQGGLFPIGTAGGGNQYGFGLMNIARIEVDGELPGALFEGNSGFNQNQFTFYDQVYDVPNPAEFGGEFGAAITAAFQNSNDNTFGAPVNTSLVPEPGTGLLMLAGTFGLFLVRRRSAPS